MPYSAKFSSFLPTSRQDGTGAGDSVVVSGLGAGGDSRSAGFGTGAGRTSTGGFSSSSRRDGGAGGMGAGGLVGPGILILGVEGMRGNPPGGSRSATFSRL